jgi:hypothetical protein
LSRDFFYEKNQKNDLINFFIKKSELNFSVRFSQP